LFPRPALASAHLPRQTAGAMTPDAPGTHNSIPARLAAVRARIAKAARDAGHEPSSVALVAVAKTHPAQQILPALQAAHRFPGIELHLIGPLQTNKVKEAVALFDVIETVDREKLARALATEMGRQGRRPDCYLQVNTGEEAQKAGVAPQEVDGFVALCRDELGLPVKGLMCIPPVDEPPAPHFALLAELAERHDLPVLSMGMSGDYEIAIGIGATHVRVGTAIFGDRPKHGE